MKIESFDKYVSEGVTNINFTGEKIFVKGHFVKKFQKDLNNNSPEIRLHTSHKNKVGKLNKAFLHFAKVFPYLFDDFSKFCTDSRL